MGGTLDKAKGRTKEAAGSLADRDDWKAEGKVDRASGSVKDTADSVADSVKDAIDGDGDRKD